MTQHAPAAPAACLLHVPSRSEPDLAILAVRTGAIRVPDARRTFDLQESMKRRGPVPLLPDLLVRAGLVSRAVLDALRLEAARRRGQARGIFFARSVESLGLTRPIPLEDLGIEEDGTTFDDRLVARGVLSARDRDRLLADHLRIEFQVEDRLYARAALLVQAASPEAIEDAVTRQHWMVASGKAPLPLSTLLPGASAIDRLRSDQILRAVRRCRVTRDPIRRHLSLQGRRP